jgi:hypothetical protein
MCNKSGLKEVFEVMTVILLLSGLLEREAVNSILEGYDI